MMKNMEKYLTEVCNSEKVLAAVSAARAEMEEKEAEPVKFAWR